MTRLISSAAIVLMTANFTSAAVNVDVNTPNASVHVGSPQPAPRVTVVERERVIEREHHRDNGKHKGHYKKKHHKKKDFREANEERHEREHRR